ncbi:MAG TPA: hypothetical protein VMR52_12475 [Dehalococcoidia bacterium]|nr:hypothetical protein [Dehalococcoidia bacterium]
MPNRRGVGYMPRRHQDSDIAKKTTAAAEAKSLERGPKGQDRRADLTDAGDFGRDYEQWSKGDLYNRASQLNVRGRSAMTKERLIESLRQAEQKKKR